MEAVLRVILMLGHPIILITAVGASILMVALYLILVRRRSLVRQISLSTVIVLATAISVSSIFVMFRKVDGTDMPFDCR